MPGRIVGLVTTELALTNKRILGRVGMFRRKKIVLSHKDIELVVAQRGLIGLLFNYGAVTISGKSGVRVKFRGISKPHDMEQRIDKSTEIAVLGRALPNLDKAMSNENSVPAVQPKPVPVFEMPVATKEAEPITEPTANRKDPNAW